ncbi:MAG: VanZ family protein [Lachnospiraceae bacterium]|nr:VanZ family protein [Lachnospiraceae bacterium]
MARLLFIGIDTVSAIIVLLPIMLIFRFTVFKQYSFKKVTLVFVYAVYLSAVFSAVGIPTINGLIVDIEFNFIPLIDVINSPVSYLKNTILNFLLFVPLGFLLPTIWNEYRSAKKTLFTGLGISLIIEILQIFTFRLTDIDDLITNTAGTILGYYLYSRFSERLHLKLPETNKKYEAFIVFIIVLLIMFSIQPLIYGVMWEYIFSSPIWESIR